MNNHIRMRLLALGVAVLIAFVGQFLLGRADAYLGASMAVAAGLWLTASEWRLRAAGWGLVAAGLFVSSLDPFGCSTGSRMRVVFEKLAGHLPFLGWDEVGGHLMSRCAGAEYGVNRRLRTIAERDAEKPWVRMDTPIGQFWLERKDRGVLAWLVWEEAVQHSYEYRGVTIRPGDTVVDCGAHIGTFTRVALSRGARQVIAIEPDPGNIRLLEANFADEISAGRVKLVKAGVWHEHSSLEFTVGDDSARGSFVRNAAGGRVSVPVMPMDDIVAQLGIDRVDFIKMDIEGAERNALRGAAATLRRFRPRMAICTYHLTDDPDVIPAVVRESQAAYRLYARDFQTGAGRYITKVVFFDPAP